MKKEKDNKSEKLKQIIEKYSIDLDKLKAEQEKLAKQLSIKDSIDFSNIAKIGAIETGFFENKIITGIVVMLEDEIIEEKYQQDKLRFPYIPGFRAYRELPAMLECFNKLEEKPELILVNGHGISHERLGLASHFSLSTNVPTIGVAESLIFGEVKNGEIIVKGKKVGKVIHLKEGSNPLYVSPGNLISIDTAAEIVRKLIQPGHKLPEPMRKAKKYVDEVRKELFGSGLG